MLRIVSDENRKGVFLFVMRKESHLSDILDQNDETDEKIEKDTRLLIDKLKKKVLKISSPLKHIAFCDGSFHLTIKSKHKDKIF